MSGKRNHAKNDDATGGYTICVHLGPAPDALVAAGVRCVSLDVTEASLDAVIAALEASSLVAADFRSHALFSVSDDIARDVALATYAGLVGFAQKRPDIAVGSRIVQARSLNSLARSVEDAGVPDPVPAQVQVGSVQHPALHSVLFSSEIDPVDASAVRHARRLRFAPADDTAAALTQFIIVAGMRAKHGRDRFPYLCDGTEAWDSSDPLHIVGLCLDTVRDRANQLRRGRHAGDRSFVVDVEELDDRRTALQQAAALPIEPVMVWLGGRQNPESGLWHCPRPERHNNGDANASMRTYRGGTRCFRCDGERVDSLRLAVDVLNLTADEAAGWLLERARRNAADLEAHAARVAAAEAAEAAAQTDGGESLDNLFT